MPAPTVAVVGGGVSGLAAARELRRRLPGARIILYEASHRLGGKIRSLERQGFLLEAAADSFLAHKPGGADFCEEIGLAGELLPTAADTARVLLYQQGRLVPLPLGLRLLAPTRLLPFLFSPAFSWRGKLHILLERLRPPADPGEETIAQFVSRRFGEEALHKLGQPMLAGVYGGDARRLSVEATFPELKALEREHGSVIRGFLARAAEGQGTGSASAFLSLRRGMEQLVRAMAAELGEVEVQLRARLRRLPEADGVVLAVPAREAARLVPDARLAALLSRQAYTSVSVVCLGYRREQVAHPLDAYGFLVPAGSGVAVKSATFSSSKLPGRAPRGSVLLRAFYPQPTPPAQLLRQAHAELTTILDISGEPRLGRVFSHRQANPQYELGHARWLEQVEERLRSHPGLQLAGASYRGSGLPDCISQGREAAVRLAERLG